MRSDAPGSALGVVLAALADDSARLTALAPAVSADEPDAVHQARVLVRRLRSVLAGARGLLAGLGNGDGGDVDRVRADLGALGDELGRIRDLEVRVAQVESYLGAPTTDELLRRLADDLRARHRAAHAGFAARLAASTDGGAPMAAPVERFLAGVARGDEHHADGSISTDRALVGMVAGEAHRVLGVAERSASSDLTSLHRLRRGARRLRYVADAVGGGVGPVRRGEVHELSSAAEAVQDLLGAHRDRRLFAAELDAVLRDGDADANAVAGCRAIAATVEAEAASLLSELPPALAELRDRASAVGEADEG